MGTIFFILRSIKMKLLILLLALCAFAQADCDFEGLQTCLTEWSEDLLGGVTGFFDSETGWCNILRDLFNCAYDNCDDLVEQDAFQQAVSLTDQANCGIWNLQFDSSLNFCGIFGDPHVVSITKDGYTAKDCDFLADSGETVFADGDNTITVVADSNVNWVDQNLTATRSVSIANSRSGNTYTFSVAPDASSISPFDEVTENDLTVGSNSFRDAVKNTFVRVSAFSNQADNQAWINVYIRSAASTQTGVCAGDTCVYSGAAAKRN